jgi:hypothetical protein
VICVLLEFVLSSVILILLSFLIRYSICYCSTRYPQLSRPHFVHLLIFSDQYGSFPQEAMIINALAMVLIATGVFMAYALKRRDFRYAGRILVSSNDI